MAGRTRVSVSDEVFERLRDDIVSGRRAPGSHHSIYSLAAQFEVSRTPVRDAVLRLADLGLVTVERNRGVRVRGITAHDIRAVYELRMMIEIPAASIAAARAEARLVNQMESHLQVMDQAIADDDERWFLHNDRALHDAVLSVMGNERATREITALRDATQTVGALTLNRSRRLAEIADEHRPIVTAIAAGDAGCARHAMRHHLAATARALMRQFGGDDAGSWPDDFLDHLDGPEFRA